MFAKRFILPAAIVLAGALALSGCSGSGGSGSSAAAEPAKDSITVAQASDISTTDPIYDSGLFSVNVFRALYDQLFYMSATGELQPRIATSWTPNADNKVWDFKLRDDVKFSDGTPLTADDVIFSIQQVIDQPDAKGKNYAASIASMVKVSDTEITFNLKASSADFARQIYYLSIVPSKLYQSEGVAAFAASPVGSGPYTFVSWDKGVGIKLKANPDYWGTKPAYTDVNVIVVADSNARLNGVLSGSVDLAAITPDQASTVSATSGFKVEQGASNQTVFVSANTKNGVLGDPNFRKAVSLAIDRTSLTQNLLGGSADPLGQTAPSVVIGHDDTIEPDAFDQAQAKALVAASAYKGEAITFDYPSDGNIVNSTQVAQSIADSLGKVGINVQLQATDWATFNINWAAKSFTGLYLFQFSPNAMDASSTLNLLYKSTGDVYWNDPALDAMIAKAAASSDTTVRQAAISDIWKYNEQQEYVINLYGSQNVVAMPTWMNFGVRGDGQVYFPDATKAQ